MADTLAICPIKETEYMPYVYALSYRASILCKQGMMWLADTLADTLADVTAYDRLGTSGVHTLING